MSTFVQNTLLILLLGGLLGLIGQGVRTIVGLKKMFDQANSQNVGQYDLFLASRLFVSLFIGFIAGAAAAFFSIKADDATVPSTATLMALAMAGYSGADFIEGIAGRFTGSSGGAADQSASNPAPGTPTAQNAGGAAPRLSSHGEANLLKA